MTTSNPNKQNNADTVWVIDDDESIRWVLETALTQEDIHVKCFTNGKLALQALQKNAANQYPPDAVITDIHMPELNGLLLINEVHRIYPNLPIIITTAYSDLDSAVASYKSGAFDYLPKPFDIDDAIALIKKALLQSQQNAPHDALNIQHIATDSEIIGEAPAMQEVFRAIGRLSQSSITVLIQGESGTGKELVARALHTHSPRAAQPFVALNMAAIPKDLIEAELFGHEKGAFTGATQQRLGRFEQTKNGTLFLDEIGDMPIEAQTRLLRVLANNEFYRVGGYTPVQANTRIITATHRNLQELVKQGLFREDLYHRLNVIRINIPPLKDRSEDIPELANHFLQLAAKELQVPKKNLSQATQQLLSTTLWPGNVRQLENLCRWLTVMAAGQEILIEDLPPELQPENQKPHQPQQYWTYPLRQWAKATIQQGQTNLLQFAQPQFEKIMIEVALEHTRGRKAEAAALLGWGRNTLTRKIQELEITT